MAPGDRGEQSSPPGPATAAAEGCHVRQVAVGLLSEPPVPQPFTIKSICAKAGHEPFGSHLAIPIPHALAVRTVHIVATQIQTPLGPLIDTVNAIEELVRALKGADLLQIALNQQCRCVFLGRCRGQTFNDHILKTSVIELVLKHLTSFTARNKLADLFEILIFFIAPNIGRGHSYNFPRLQHRHLQPQPAGQGRPEINLIPSARQCGNRHRWNNLPDAVERTGLRTDRRAGRCSRYCRPPRCGIQPGHTPIRNTLPCIEPFTAEIVPFLAANLIQPAFARLP